MSQLSDLADPPHRLDLERYDVYWWGKNDNMNNESLAHSTTAGRADGGGPLWGSNPYNQSDPRFYSFLYEPLDASKANTTQDAVNVLSAIEFLRSRDADSPPFMIFLPLLYPHPPYSCPEVRPPGTACRVGISPPPNHSASFKRHRALSRPEPRPAIAGVRISSLERY